jgi:hypothetical protein
MPVTRSWTIKHSGLCQLSPTQLRGYVCSQVDDCAQERRETNKQIVELVVTSLTTSPGFGRLPRTAVRRAASAQWLDPCDVTGVSLCMHMGQWPLVHRHCPNLHGGWSPSGIISQTALRAVETCLAIAGSFVDKSRGQKFEKQLMV